jgi:hypothetical protein
MDLINQVQYRLRMMDKAGAEELITRLSFGTVGRDAWEQALTETARSNVRLSTLLHFAEYFSFTSSCSTAYVNLKTRRIYLNPEFLCESWMKWSYVLFFILHEKEHVILQSYFGDLRRHDTKLHATDNLVEDVFVNARVRPLFTEGNDPTQPYYEEYGAPGDKCTETHGAYAMLRGDFGTTERVLRNHYAADVAKYLRAAWGGIARALENDYRLARQMGTGKAAWDAWDSLVGTLKDPQGSAASIVGYFMKVLRLATLQYSTYPLFRLTANAVFHELRAAQLKSEQEDPQKDAPSKLGDGSAAPPPQEEDSEGGDLTDEYESAGGSEGSDSSEEEGDESEEEGDESEEEGDEVPDTQPGWADWNEEVEKVDYKEEVEQREEEVPVEGSANDPRQAIRRAMRQLGGALGKSTGATKLGVNSRVLRCIRLPDDDKPVLSWVDELLMADTNTTPHAQKKEEPLRKALQAIGDGIVGDLRAAQDDAEKVRLSMSPTGQFTSRELTYMAMGQIPTSWSERVERKDMHVVIYVDVSASMNAYYQLIKHLVKMLAEMCGQVYQFSGDVVEADAYVPELYTNSTTDYQCVANHILQHGFTNVIVLTDHTACINERTLAELGNQLETLYLISTPEGAGPNEPNPQGFRALQARAKAGEFPNLFVVDVPIPQMLL